VSVNITYVAGQFMEREERQMVWSLIKSILSSYNHGFQSEKPREKET